MQRRHGGARVSARELRTGVVRDAARFEVATGHAPTDITALRELRRRYMEAAQLCERCAEIMEEHARKGTMPSVEEQRIQSDARHALMAAQRAFLEGLTLYRLTL
jgi:hypothetical protein